MEIDESKQPRRQFAKVTTLACDDSPATDGPTEIEEKVMSRIRKCLDLAKHPNTGEAEASAALRMAHRIMQEHNIQQAEVYAEEVASVDGNKLGGHSTVEVRSNKDRIIFETWGETAVTAITTFFDCKTYYTTSTNKIEWTLYGIAPNTAAAAMAFEMVYNITHEWAAKLKKGNKNSYRLGVADGLLRAARKEKKLEKEQAANREAEDLKARQKEEIEQRQREIDRLENGMTNRQVAVEDADVSTGGSEIKKESFKSEEIPEGVAIKLEGYNDPAIKSEFRDWDSDTGDFEIFAFDGGDLDEKRIDINADLDDEIRQHMPRNIIPAHSDLPPLFSEALTSPPSEPSTPVSPLGFEPDSAQSQKLACGADHELEVGWSTLGELVRYQNSADVIAEQYLKAQDKKFTKGRKRNATICDFKAYHTGEVDSEKIDVKRRRIENGGASKENVAPLSGRS